MSQKFSFATKLPDVGQNLFLIPMKHVTICNSLQNLQIKGANTNR